MCCSPFHAPKANSKQSVGQNEISVNTTKIYLHTPIHALKCGHMYAHLIKYKCVCVCVWVGACPCDFYPHRMRSCSFFGTRPPIPLPKKNFICLALSLSLIPALTFAMHTQNAEYSGPSESGIPKIWDSMAEVEPIVYSLLFSSSILRKAYIEK